MFVESADESLLTTLLSSPLTTLLIHLLNKKSTEVRRVVTTKRRSNHEARRINTVQRRITTKRRRDDDGTMTRRRRIDDAWTITMSQNITFARECERNLPTRKRGDSKPACKTRTSPTNIAYPRGNVSLVLRVASQITQALLFRSFFLHQRTLSVSTSPRAIIRMRPCCCCCCCCWWWWWWWW